MGPGGWGWLGEATEGDVGVSMANGMLVYFVPLALVMTSTMETLGSLRAMGTGRPLAYAYSALISSCEGMKWHSLIVTWLHIVVMSTHSHNQGVRQHSGMIKTP